MKIMQKTGLFISVEGIDGAGKSTQVTFIKQYLEDKGKQVILTREPGGTELGEKIRDLLLNSQQMHPVTELLLMFASRQELINNIIIPKLQQGVCVVADRFIDAAIAYQGGGRGLGLDKVSKVISLLEPQLQTDLTFLFDAPLSLALNRVARNRQKDRIEQETGSFFARVQHTYHEIAKQEPERVKVINTNQALENTHTLVARYLDQLLSR
jgi:dTMP kinase